MMSKFLIIVGAGGHGKVAADTALKVGYENIIFFDSNNSIKECVGFPVLGKSDMTEKYKCWDFFVAIGNADKRQEISEILNEKECNIVSLIHPNAVISRRVKIGKGTAVMASAVINSDAVIGDGCIINTSTSIDHDCVVEDYAHISVGAHLAGSVYVGQRTWIGAGATVSNNVVICPACMIGAGAVVIGDINESGTFVGVPARRMNMEQKKVKNAGGVSHRIVNHKAFVQLSMSGRAA